MIDRSMVGWLSNKKCGKCKWWMASSSLSVGGQKQKDGMLWVAAAAEAAFSRKRTIQNHQSVSIHNTPQKPVVGDRESRSGRWLFTVCQVSKNCYLKFCVLFVPKKLNEIPTFRFFRRCCGAGWGCPWRRRLLIVVLLVRVLGCQWDGDVDSGRRSSSSRRRCWCSIIIVAPGRAADVRRAGRARKRRKHQPALARAAPLLLLQCRPRQRKNRRCRAICCCGRLLFRFGAARIRRAAAADGRQLGEEVPVVGAHLCDRVPTRRVHAQNRFEQRYKKSDRETQVFLKNVFLKKR